MSKYQIKSKANFVGVWDGDTELAYWHAHNPDAFKNAKEFIKNLEQANQRRDTKGRFVKSDV